jgi:hypothetical protein
MSARELRISAAVGVVLAAWKGHRGSEDAASVAVSALECTGMLRSPESAAELERLRARVAELEAAGPHFVATWRGHRGAPTTDYAAAWAEADAAHQRGERDASVVHSGQTKREWVADAARPGSERTAAESAARLRSVLAPAVPPMARPWRGPRGEGS